MYRVASLIKLITPPNLWLLFVQSLNLPAPLAFPPPSHSSICYKVHKSFPCQVQNFSSHKLSKQNRIKNNPHRSILERKKFSAKMDIWGYT